MMPRFRFVKQFIAPFTAKPNQRPRGLRLETEREGEHLKAEKSYVAGKKGRRRRRAFRFDVIL